MTYYTQLVDELIQDLEGGIITRDEYEKILADLKKHFEID